jgi:hypothetical protein
MPEVKRGAPVNETPAHVPDGAATGPSTVQATDPPDAGRPATVMASDRVAPTSGPDDAATVEMVGAKYLASTALGLVVMGRK